MNLAASAQLSDDTSTFSGEVAATCSISGLNSEYQLSRDISFDEDYLHSGYQSFNVSANTKVKLVTNYQIIGEPSGFTPDTRKVMMRQCVNGECDNTVQALQPGVDSSNWFFLTDTPGTASAQLRMFVGPNLLPGDYSYQVTIKCLM